MHEDKSQSMLVIYQPDTCHSVTRYYAIAHVSEPVQVVFLFSKHLHILKYFQTLFGKEYLNLIATSAGGTRAQQSAATLV